MGVVITKPVSPITPAEALSLKERLLPDEVIGAWNELIATNLTNGVSTVYQSEAEDKLRMLSCLPSDQSVLDMGWLDIEDIYRAAGWKVFYDKPGYNESYEATYKFSKKGSRD